MHNRADPMTRLACATLLLFIACWAWLAVSALVYSFRHPSLTETQVILAWREWAYCIGCDKPE